MTYHNRDLEVIVTSLEVAALLLTTKTSHTFFRTRLFEEARKLVSDLVEDDLVNVFENMSHLFGEKSEGYYIK